MYFLIFRDKVKCKRKEFGSKVQLDNNDSPSEPECEDKGCAYDEQ